MIIITLICAFSHYAPTKKVRIPASTQKNDAEVALENLKLKTLEVLTYAEKAAAWREQALQTFVRTKTFQKNHNGQLSAYDLAEILRGSTYYIKNIHEPLTFIVRTNLFYKEIEYRRSLSKQEVDFLVSENLNDIIGIEVNSKENPSKSARKCYQS